MKTRISESYVVGSTQIAEKIDGDRTMQIGEIPLLPPLEKGDKRGIWLRAALGIVLFSILLFFFFFSGCAPRQTWKSDYNFAGIRKIAIAKFDAPASAASAGESARALITSYLTQKGFSVIDPRVLDRLLEQSNPCSPAMYAQIGSLAGADAVIDGSVVQYIPEKKERVSYAAEGGKAVYDTYFYGSGIFVTARLIDVKSGEVVWSNSGSYDSLDINNTLKGAVYTAVAPFIKLLTEAR